MNKETSQEIPLHGTVLGTAIKTDADDHKNSDNKPKPTPIRKELSIKHY